MPDTAQPQPTGGVEPTLARNGKLSYIQIPAADTAVSAAFYRGVFGWSILNANPAHTSFADASGELIGAFVTGREIAAEAGHLPYIYVDSIDGAVAGIAEHGGEIVRPPYPEGALWVATFRDPAGNLLGVWTQSPR